MKCWLAPPIYIRDAYITIIRALHERGGDSGTSVDAVINSYWPIPKSRPMGVLLWRNLRDQIKGLMGSVFVVPNNTGAWTKVYPYRSLTSEKLDDIIFDLLNKAGISPDGWFFESNRPVSWVNQNFLEAAYYLLNNVLVYINYNARCSSFAESNESVWNWFENRLVSSRTITGYTNLIAGTTSKSYSENRLTKMLSRFYRVEGCNMRGSWSLKCEFFLLQPTGFGETVSVVAKPGVKQIDFSDNQSGDVPIDAGEYVDLNKYLNPTASSMTAEYISLYEAHTGRNTNDLFSEGDTQISVTRDNLPPLNYKYLDL